MSLHNDPYWPRASDWLRGKTLPQTVGSINFVGVPLNASITPGSCDQGPSALRAALSRLSCYDAVLHQDVRELAARDFGTIEVDKMKPEQAFEFILNSKQVVAVRKEPNVPTVFLGGDNGITRPCLHALGELPERVGLLTLDAHLDLRHMENGLHNGNPIRALIADGVMPQHISQIGIQSFANSWEYFHDAREMGITTILSETCHEQGFVNLVKQELDRLSAQCEVIYVDLDLDVMDAAFAPGCPGSRPGGILPHELFGACRLIGSYPKVAAMDVVELDPAIDLSTATALAGGKAILAFAAGVAKRGGLDRA